MNTTNFDPYYARTHIEEIILALDVAEKYYNNFVQIRQREGDEGITFPELAQVLRMTMCWMAINLCRILEVWQRYHALSDSTIKAKMKTIFSELQTRKVATFRNTIAAHLEDKQTGSPPTGEEIVQQLHTMWKGTDPTEFFEWIDSDVEREGSVCSVLAEFFFHIEKHHTVVEPDYVQNAARMLAQLPAWRRQANDEEG